MTDDGGTTVDDTNDDGAYKSTYNDDGTGPTLTLGGAVRATGVARSTLQRKLRDGQIPGAHHTAGGNWAIPVAGLIQAGLAPKQTPPDDDPGPAVDADQVSALRAENSRLRAELDAARQVQELQASNLDDLRAALAVVSRRELAPVDDTNDDTNDDGGTADDSPGGRAPGRLRTWWRNL